jgi:hypothetical protein
MRSTLDPALKSGESFEATESRCEEGTALSAATACSQQSTAIIRNLFAGLTVITLSFFLFDRLSSSEVLMGVQSQDKSGRSGPGKWGLMSYLLQNCCEGYAII